MNKAVYYFVLGAAAAGLAILFTKRHKCPSMDDAPNVGAGGYLPPAQADASVVYAERSAADPHRPSVKPLFRRGSAYPRPTDASGGF